MAKVGNLQQGYVGKLNGQAYYKGADGKTVVRKITVPKNPKTLAQRVQRVITKTVGDNYKMMKAIADHSFEGKSMGYQCANRFRSLNASRMRERAAYLQEAGVSLYSYYQFERLGSTKITPAAVFISEGTLNQVTAMISDNKAKVVVSANTYAGVISSLRAQRGDQMTFVTVEKVGDDYEFHYARVILDPRNENGAADTSVAFIDNNAIGSPNSRNKGSFVVLNYSGGNIEFKMTSGNVVAAGIIMSRKSDSKWFRSTCQLTINEAGFGSDLLSLMAAAEDSDSTFQIDVESEQFLNNAGTGGSAGTSTPAGGESSTPTVSTTARINGASQSIAGGSANVTSLTSFAFQGSNLSQGSYHMTKNSGASVQPSSTTDSAVTWNISEATVGDVYRFYVGDTLKCTVTVVSAGGGPDDDPDEN